MQLEERVILRKGEILCAEGELTLDLYYLISGELMAFTRKEKLISPLGIINEDEFVGELSFFDHRPRSASLVAIKNSVLMKVSADALIRNMPNWLKSLGLHMTDRLRTLNSAVREEGIKKKNVDAVKSIPLEQQGLLLRSLQEYLERKNG